MKALKIMVAVVLALHGLIHLIGTAAYLKLADVQGFPYKTTVLSGRWDLGQVGMNFFGVLWAVAAIGFVVAAIAFLINLTWWQPALLWVTLLSLMLTVLDSSNAYAGIFINSVILAVLWLGRGPMKRLAT
jgi:hypothetical protein